MSAIRDSRSAAYLRPPQPSSQKLRPDSLYWFIPSIQPDNSSRSTSNPLGDPEDNIFPTHSTVASVVINRCGCGSGPASSTGGGSGSWFPSLALLNFLTQYFWLA